MIENGEDPLEIAISRVFTPRPTNCSRCRREVWIEKLPITANQCEFAGGVTCLLTMSVNSLVSALKSVLKTPMDKTVIRTALAVIESVRPSSRHCPTCEKACVVVGNTVSVHYPSNESTIVCSASFHTVLGGVLMEKGK